MNIDKNRRSALLSWLFVGVLFALCGVLGVLQYRWIGEVSVAARERLRASLQSSVVRLSQDFNNEITSACRPLLPAGFERGAAGLEEELGARYRQWKTTSRHVRVFQRIAVVAPREGSVTLRTLDLETGAFTDAAWPPEWKGLKDRLELWLSPEPWQNRGLLGRRPEYSGAIFEVPLFAMPRPGTPPVPFGRREGAWVIFEFNAQYACEVILAELMQRHLGAGGHLDYQVEVLTRAKAPSVVYQSDPEQAKGISTGADASISLLELRYDRLFRRGRFPGQPERDSVSRPPERGPGPDIGRWQMFVRHRAGSLDAVVTRARWRNLAVTAGILLLMLASVAALIRFTRRAQRLAELQMGFVAGVSHELRTPLTVIHTAAYNLRGRLAQNPTQVERYGTLIQQESGRLKELVEQVLGFAGAQAGRVVKEPEPLCVQTLIEQTVESGKAVLQVSGCVVEKKIDPDLPLILGDPLALKQALHNLLGNAAKYGTEGSNWIGIFAAKTSDKERAAVEIRVADRGPGIPADEQEHVFDAFFRGRRAVQDQVHGTGLGLNLVKKIVEAHGGTIRLKSEPMKGTEFIVRIPAAPPEYVDEFADSVGRG